MPLAVHQTIPILRIFDLAKAREFYVDYLGFQVDWEHRFEPGLPLYMQISRAGLVIHLSEHHGDACPGSTVFLRASGLADFHAELTARNYGYLRPGLEDHAWRQAIGLELIDPFGNRLRFSESTEKTTSPDGD
jgi:ribosomal-protein-alanine N-acetyltransferase